MNVIDTIAACTVEENDTVSFTCSVDGELYEELMTVDNSYLGCDDEWVLDGYSHNEGEMVIRFVDPDLEVDLVGEL